MIPSPVRLFNPTGPDRVAVLSVEPSTGTAGAFLIRHAHGSGPILKKGSVYGPFPETELEARFAEFLAELRAEGFVPAGVHDLLQKLLSKHEGVRARAALGLGRRKVRDAVDALLNLLAAGGAEAGSVLDALGDIGDPRAIPACREQATRKLLSRRRSAVEALRRLNAFDPAATLDRLPETIRPLVDGSLQQTLDALAAVKLEQRGLALDTLYELGTPWADVVVRQAVREWPIDRPHLWRYAKSVGKRAMLRRDFGTFALLAHRIETLSRSNPGHQATVKSGLDGVQRPTHVFGPKTQQFMKRLAWRYLRQLASHEPDRYPAAAAEVLVLYSPDDATVPKGFYGQFAACYLLHRIAWGRSSRYKLNDRTLKFRFREAFDTTPPTNVAIREEPYPHLWDAHPRAYLRLLAAAKLPEVQAFANRAVDVRHPNLLQQADWADLVAMLAAPWEATLDKALAELERRFDPANADWVLLDQLLESTHAKARALGEKWLRLTAPRWTLDGPAAVRFLTSSHPTTRAIAAELVANALQNSSLRAEYAAAIVAMIREAKLEAERSSGVLTVGRLLSEDISRLVSVVELTAWLDRRPLAFLPLLGDLLAARPEPLAELGTDRLIEYAQDAAVVIRTGAFAVLDRGREAFRTDRTPLLTLAESRWPDSRAFAVRILREDLDREATGLDDVVGFLDSEHTELQDFGQELARQRLSFLPADKLAVMLAEHPHRSMREFVWELVFDHLPDTEAALAVVEPFVRTALFDLRPRTKLKRRVLAFLGRRGQQDAGQAAVAVRILGQVVRVQGRADFEDALESLVRLRLAFPEVESPMTLAGGTA